MREISKTELKTLESLLVDHIKTGEYWGNNEQHYEMCTKLLNWIRKELLKED